MLKRFFLRSAFTFVLLAWGVMGGVMLSSALGVPALVVHFDAPTPPPIATPPIVMPDEYTVLVRKPNSWFHITCVKATPTSIMPNYSDPYCWPHANEKLIDADAWPEDDGHMACFWLKKEWEQ